MICSNIRIIFPYRLSISISGASTVSSAQHHILGPMDELQSSAGSDEYYDDDNDPLKLFKLQRSVSSTSIQVSL